MRILLTPMATVGETGGSMTRTRAIAFEAMKRGHEVAFCAGDDINWRPIDGVPSYDAPIPTPGGVPLFVGRRIFPLAKRLGDFVDRLGVRRQLSIDHFEQVLHYMGAIRAATTSTWRAASTFESCCPKPSPS